MCHLKRPAFTLTVTAVNVRNNIIIILADIESWPKTHYFGPTVSVISGRNKPNFVNGRNSVKRHCLTRPNVTSPPIFNVIADNFCEMCLHNGYDFPVSFCLKYAIVHYWRLKKITYRTNSKPSVSLLLDVKLKNFGGFEFWPLLKSALENLRSSSSLGGQRTNEAFALPFRIRYLFSKAWQ